MQSTTGKAPPRRCSYCNEPFCFTSSQVRALPVGNQFVCNEFCAQSLREEAYLVMPRAS